ncbi:MAG: hypothetical protein ABL964_09825 [Steroidobacteraceae bacterium]
MSKIQLRIGALLREHKSYRGVQSATGVNYTQLQKLHSGKLESASDETLAKLGLVKRVTYHDA